MVNELPGEFVLRFMTSHPKDAGEALFRAMAECEKVETHLHLPFQSGSDTILKKMNRHYTRDDYLALVELARRYVPELVVTSDIIVGFPGETERDFLDTMDVIERVRFDALFTFIYSRRPGTPAAEMDDPDPREVKQERFDRLIAGQKRHLR
jgi:tRNA-2-methylthio-N6-dimethylallyladenosine synthase